MWRWLDKLIGLHLAALATNQFLISNISSMFIDLALQYCTGIGLNKFALLLFYLRLKEHRIEMLIKQTVLQEQYISDILIETRCTWRQHYHPFLRRLASAFHEFLSCFHRHSCPHHHDSSWWGMEQRETRSCTVEPEERWSTEAPCSPTLAANKILKIR